jgi:hypothetical protein
MSAQSDLFLIQKIIDGLDKNPVARMAYTQAAFDSDIVDGVDAFDRNAEQNVPKADRTDYNPTVPDKGVRTQGASIPRNGWNHYIGRLSYNSNKLVQKLLKLVGLYGASMAHNACEYDGAAKYRAGDICYTVQTIDSVRVYAWHQRTSLSPETIQGIHPAIAQHWEPVQETSGLDSRLPLQATGYRHKFTVVDLSGEVYDGGLYYPCVAGSFASGIDDDTVPLQVLFEAFTETPDFSASLAVLSKFSGFIASSKDVVFDCSYMRLSDGALFSSASSPIGYSKLAEERKAVVWLKGGQKYALWNSFGAPFYLEGGAPEPGRIFDIAPATVQARLKTPAAAALDEAPNLGQVLALIVDRGTPIKTQLHLAQYRYSRHDATVRAQGNVDVREGGLLLLDGIQLADGSLVFLTEQAAKVENGLYAAREGAWERAVGYGPEDGQAFDNEYIHVLSGTDAGKIYCTKTELYEIDTDPIEFFESAFSPAKLPGKILIRDRDGNFECGRGGGSGPGPGPGPGNGDGAVYLMAEDDDYLVTEDGNYLVVEEDS